MNALLDPIAAAAEAFAPITLDAIGEAALMDRVDRKYLVPAALLPDVLDKLAGDYRVLEVNGRRLSRYSTRYFDTPGLDLYLDHHNDRAPRFKVRVRTYQDAPAGFLEVKRKTAAGRTLKSRVLLEGGAEPMARLRAESLQGAAEALAVDHLAEAMVVEYTRLTLVRNDSAERITLDLMLTFRRSGELRVFPKVVIAEVKQAGHAPSPFVAAMRALHIREGAISKYCAGIASLEPTAKTNRFRPALRRLHAIGDAVSMETH